LDWIPGFPPDKREVMKKAALRIAAIMGVILTLPGSCGNPVGPIIATDPVKLPPVNSAIDYSSAFADIFEEMTRPSADGGREVPLVSSDDYTGPTGTSPGDIVTYDYVRGALSLSPLGGAEGAKTADCAYLLTMIDTANNFTTSYSAGSRATKQIVDTYAVAAALDLVSTGKFVAIGSKYGSGSIAAYSTDGSAWWTAETLPKSTNLWHGIAYGGGKFVLIDGGPKSNRAAYSADGITWTETTLPSAANWRGITYGGGKFVVVSDGYNTAAYSSDGISWTGTPVLRDTQWRTAAYGGGRFVMIGMDGRAAYSSDGITWTETALPGGGNWTGIAYGTYGSGRFVAIGDGNKAAYSDDDGETWTVYTLTGSMTGEDWRGVAYDDDDSNFIIIGSSGKLAHSNDGIGWATLVSPLSNGDWTAITYIHSKFFAVGKDSKAAYSANDGGSWTEYSWPGGAWTDIASYSIDSGTDAFFAVNEVNTAMKTFTLVPPSSPPPPSTWTLPTETAELPVLPAGAKWWGVTYGGGKILLVGDGATALSSDGGSNWNVISMPANAAWQDVAYGAGKFVMVGTTGNGAAAYSEDNGVTWRPTASLPSAGNWTSIAYGGGRFVAINNSDNTAAYSDNGITWTGAGTALPASAKWRGITYGNSRFVAVGDNGDKTAYSADGNTWMGGAALPALANRWGITYGNGRFVAVGDNGDKTAYLTDGSTGWTTVTLPPNTAQWHSVTYGE
jgi:hypothetical protein